MKINNDNNFIFKNVVRYFYESNTEFMLKEKILNFDNLFKFYAYFHYLQCKRALYEIHQFILENFLQNPYALTILKKLSVYDTFDIKDQILEYLCENTNFLKENL